jgi:DNA-binding IclR family transcriptional regulator
MKPKARIKSAPIRRNRIETTEDSDRSAVKSLAKALDLLEAVATMERAPTIAEVALGAGVPRATAYRLVEALIAEGYLVQDPIDGRLAIGFAVLPLAGSLLDSNRMRLEALPHLEALARRTNVRVNLGILYRNRVLYLAGVEKPSLPTIYSRFGKTTPAHCCSLGKAILAHLPEADSRALVAATGLAAQTPNTITELKSFLKDLAETRARGYAIDREEGVPGSFCVATTIFDSARRPIGAIGLTGSALEPLITETDHLRHTAEVISHVL